MCNHLLCKFCSHAQVTCNFTQSSVFAPLHGMLSLKLIFVEQKFPLYCSCHTCKQSTSITVESLTSLWNRHTQLSHGKHSTSTVTVCTCITFRPLLLILLKPHIGLLPATRLWLSFPRRKPQSFIPEIIPFMDT